MLDEDGEYSLEREYIEELEPEDYNPYPVGYLDRIDYDVDDDVRPVNSLETLILDLISKGAKDRFTAIRWIHLSECTDGNNERLLAAFGLPSDYPIFAGA